MVPAHRHQRHVEVVDDVGLAVPEIAAHLLWLVRTEEVNVVVLEVHIVANLRITTAAQLIEIVKQIRRGIIAQELQQTATWKVLA